MCVCRFKMYMQHAMNCKKGGFITIRHSGVRDLTDDLLTIIQKDMEIELKLLPITEEAFDYQTANASNETRVDIRARGFWEIVAKSEGFHLTLGKL